MSLGGSDKVKPEMLFDSLRIMKAETSSTSSVSEKFIERFRGKLTEQPEFLDV